jgi:hypothetical protein
MPLSRREILSAQRALPSAGLMPHIGACLADSYEPQTMPTELLPAHETLDKDVDKCYRAQAFTTDAKWVEYLFELYEKYSAGLWAGEKPKKKK